MEEEEKADGKEDRSVELFGIRPAGQAGDRVELPEQLPHQPVGVVFRAQLFELADDARQCLVGIGDGALRRSTHAAAQGIRGAV